MSEDDSQEKPPTWVDQFLGALERVGNLLPHPVTLFALFALGTIVISAIGAHGEWAVEGIQLVASNWGIQLVPPTYFWASNWRTQLVPPTYFGSRAKLVPPTYFCTQLVPPTYFRTQLVPPTYFRTQLVPPTYFRIQLVPPTYFWASNWCRPPILGLVPNWCRPPILGLG